MHEKHPIQTSNISSRQLLLQKIEQYTELPLMIAALIMIPLSMGQFFWEISEKTAAIFFSIDAFIWAIFAIDFIVKIGISSKRLEYLKTHWVDLVVIVLPWFRPLRIIRIIIFAVRSYQGATRIGKPDFLVLYAAALIIFAATAVTTVEQGHQMLTESGALVPTSLSSFSNALWWSIVTITTVGYGDMTPTTEIGRAIAYVLMIGGVCIFGGITANLAAFFVKPNGNINNSLTELTEEIKILRTELKDFTGKDSL